VEKGTRVGRRGRELLEPLRKRGDLARVSLRLHIRHHVGEQLAVALAGFDLDEKCVGVDSGEREKALIDRAVVVEIARFANDDGTRFIEQTWEMHEAAETRARAARRMLREIGCAKIYRAVGGGGIEVGGLEC